ncbi:MAG: hypothetical protein QNI99_02130 [Woeseiaceae bacterium]|nr:hypothetical protein [Woeseiaceae bacterium]
MYLRAALLLLIAFPAVASERNLDVWIDRNLVPYVTEQLTTHPRFRGETVMFVVLDGEAPASASNELALSIRDRLLDAALDTGNIDVGLRQGNGSGPLDCTRDDVHYYIGLDLSARVGDELSVRVRALDLEDRNWVNGFALSWRGRLDGGERRALGRQRIDETFLGARDAPFTDAQTDLLAAHLAQRLSCELLRQSGGSYVVPAPADGEEDDSLAGTVELVGNNIAANAAIELTTDEASANAMLSGKAHQIDRDLYQYWLTVTPSDEQDELTTISVSAYVRLPGLAYAAARPAQSEDPVSRVPLSPPPAVAEALPIPRMGDAALIGPLSIAAPASVHECGNDRVLASTRDYRGRSSQCSLLRTYPRQDAIVFFLEHQPHLGLVRLGERDCRDRTSASVVRQGESLDFPIAWYRHDTTQTRQVGEWQTVPSTDTYYAVALTDPRAARRIANHIDTLPIRCGASLRPGLTGGALERWLDEFQVLAASAAGHMDWRAIAIRDVL